MYDNIFLGNIKKLYKSAVKYNYQRKYKLILEASIFSTPEGGTYNSLMLPCQSVYVKILVQENHSVNFQKHFM